MKIETLKQNDENSYEIFLSNRPDATIYHTLYWKKIMDSSFDLKSYYFLAKDNDSRIQAVLPIYLIKNYTGSRLESIPFSIYGGVIGDSKYISPLISRVIDLKDELNCDFIRIKQPNNDYDSILNSYSFTKYENRWNQCVQIKNPKILWLDIKKSNRNAIRQAIRNGLIFENSENIKDIKDFYELDLITRRRTGFFPPPITIFENMWNILHPKGYFQLFNVKYKKKSIAAALVLIYNNSVLCSCAASETKSLKLRPNNFLFWKLIEWCYNNNYDIVDLGMCPKDNIGLDFFKKSFQSLNVSYGHHYFPKDFPCKENSNFDKIGKIFIKFFPVSLMRSVGPFITKRFC